MLDTVEALLRFQGNVSGNKLEPMLSIGNSAYSVRSDGRGLEMRIVPEVGQIVEDTVRTAAGSAGAHLSKAWNAAYGRDGDPGTAYSEAIKAVEAAAIPVVSPNNAKATLGTVRGELKANAHLWQFVIDPQQSDSMETVVGMITTLWEGQTSRHGGAGPTVPETPEQARAAVHLAATLVQWFISGAVYRNEAGLASG